MLLTNLLYSIKDKIKKLYRYRILKSAAKKDFVIISNNCWGAEIYKRYNKPYNTPFIGLFLYGPDYIKLLQDFKYYMALPLVFVNQSRWEKELKYPVGKLDDIEIHFMHYANEEEAALKWQRRLARMNRVTEDDEYYFKICDRAETSEKIIRDFHHLPFSNKISFGINDYQIKNHIVIIENDNNVCVPDGVKLYLIMNKYIKIDKWILYNELVKRRH